MGVFSTTKTFPVRISDTNSLAKDVIDYFTSQDYEIVDEPMASGGWHISISKGGVFKSVLGLKTSLNIEITKSIEGTTVKAEVGIFGQQAIPSIISLFITWPVLLTQIWGAVKQSKLDEEVMECVEGNIEKYTTSQVLDVGENEGVVFCVECGHKLHEDDDFCGKCGAKKVFQQSQ